MTYKNLVQGAVLAAALGFGGAANALPFITGGVSFGGTWAPTGGTGIADATGVNIIGDSAVVNCAFTSTCTGSYAGVTGLFAATYNDFSFNPLGGGITPLWTFTFGGLVYSFDLESVNVVTQDSEFLTLDGTGTLFITDGLNDVYSPTIGRWTFSGDSAGATIAFSSTTNAVSEPGTLGLLAFGIFAAGAIARRKQKLG